MLFGTLDPEKKLNSLLSSFHFIIDELDSHADTLVDLADKKKQQVEQLLAGVSTYTAAAVRARDISGNIKKLLGL